MNLAQIANHLVPIPNQRLAPRMQKRFFCLGIVRYLLFHADALEELLDNALHGKEVTLPVHAERELHPLVRIVDYRQAPGNIDISQLVETDILVPAIVVRRQ